VTTAFVLSGGGNRGPLEVGALRALLEHGIVPDFFVGTSAGSVNSAFMAAYGPDLAATSRLAAAWHSASPSWRFAVPPVCPSTSASCRSAVATHTSLPSRWKARRALFFARYEASKLGSKVIESEHILLGILREGEDVTREIFTRLTRSAGSR